MNYLEAFGDKKQRSPGGLLKTKTIEQKPFWWGYVNLIFGPGPDLL